MRPDLAANGKKIAKRAIATQALVSTILSAIFMLSMGFLPGLSVFTGALISILPNSVFAVFAFRYAGARQNQQVARSFSQGAKVKLALSIILFVIAFKGLNVIPLALFLGYAIATVSYWLALLQQHQQR
ncbi:ATP synthase subunit I [Salinimonas sediminis]|uniref:ATPase F0F1 n=1 Tax=Salinimonas sediminis TaxID=2303538 RepID=A0A346NH94_9ALTE|nr:ATP synthase subunit I [Salinimonas sediminis]AXR04901.1 ATPase F0F1 [Salinimonas sediminis]